jgi:uncharacterized protein involved in exopolysaccharide biosynthesis
MNENEMVADDEISLFDLWEKLRNGWLAVVCCTVLGITGAVLAIFLIPPKYEAVALVQVGQVGQVGQVRVAGQPVEPPVQAVERMKAPAFQRRVAEALGDQKWLHEVARIGATKDLALQVVKATVGADQVPLIELRVSGNSPESALKKTQAVIAQLISIHGELAKPALNRMRTDLAITREKLTSAERDLESLNKLVAAAGVKDDRFTQLALMTSLRIQKEAETFNQRQMIMALETALEAPSTQAAKAIEEVFIADKPVSPKKSLLLVLGTIGGLLGGVLWVFIGDVWRRARKQKRAAS